jgi:hypothetical protein
MPLKLKQRWSLDSTTKTVIFVSYANANSIKRSL